jgi:hypothetical protein
VHDQAAPARPARALPGGALGIESRLVNPRTTEAFSSHGNGTLSVIKEKSPTEFVLEETVKTKAGAKTCTLDAKTES